MSDDLASAQRSIGRLTYPFLDLLPVMGLAISVLGRNRQPSLVHATDAVAARLEEVQFDLGEGPSFTTVSRASLVSVPNVSEADQWPAFARGAEELGVGAVFVFPLMLGAVCMGSVLCYRTSRGDLDDTAISVGVSLSRSLAGPVFRRAILVAEDESPVEERREVHQATGMILWHQNVSATDAFSRLRAYSFSTGRPVQEVAHSIVNRRFDLAHLSD